MKCTICNQGIEEHRDLYPIEPAGTKNRKWACTVCISKYRLKIDKYKPKED